MDKYIFDESNGLWYELQDDYYIPCLILSEEETQPIGLWGQRHKQYLKEHKHFLYTTMLIEGTLNSYLADIDKQAQERLLLLTKQIAEQEIAEQENVTEQLKADNAMLWVQKMNEIQSRVREIIYNEIIYA
ncbi:MAG: TnpV protein [Clostridiales bacterium]|nr:TnpV protein [Clostridiales bacterium]